MDWQRASHFATLIRGTTEADAGPWADFLEAKASVAARRVDLAAQARLARSEALRACTISAAGALPPSHRSWVFVVDKRLHASPEKHRVPIDVNGSWVFPSPRLIRSVRDTLAASIPKPHHAPDGTSYAGLTSRSTST